MPLFKCDKCHHEWEGSEIEVYHARVSYCDWCGEEGHVIMAETGLEQMLKSMSRARRAEMYRDIAALLKDVSNTSARVAPARADGDEDEDESVPKAPD